MADKHLPPTPKRLRDARRRGDVAFSCDTSAAVVFAMMVAALWGFGPPLLDLLRDLWTHATTPALLSRPGESFPQVLLHAAHVLTVSMLAVAAGAAAGAVLGSFAQVGPLMAWERLKPDASRLNPAAGLQRIFSTRALFNLAKMVVKTLLLAGLVWAALRGELATALKLGHVAPAAILGVGARVLLAVFAWGAVIYAVLAGADFAHQRFEHHKALRMSLDEVRREYKDMEGDPMHRSRRRSAHVEAIYFSLADRVRSASAVIEGDGVAVALQYLGPQDLPRVIARGDGEPARRIVDVAREALVPVRTDAALAAAIFVESAPDRPIAPALYAPVADLLRWARGDDPG
jgi:type III secretion protein U